MKLIIRCLFTVLYAACWLVLCAGIFIILVPVVAFIWCLPGEDKSYWAELKDIIDKVFPPPPTFLWKLH